jgi:hypothetical protein
MTPSIVGGKKGQDTVVEKEVIIGLKLFPKPIKGPNIRVVNSHFPVMPESSRTKHHQELDEDEDIV